MPGWLQKDRVAATYGYRNRKEEDEKHAGKHGISLTVPKSEYENHERAVARAIDAYGPGIAPALPVIAHRQLILVAQVSKFSNVSQVIAPTSAFLQRSHIEKHGAKFMQQKSPMYGMIHQLLTEGEIRESEGAQAALKVEWDKLIGKAFSLDQIQSKADVIQKAQQEGFRVHFGSLIALCHKNDQLGQTEWKYKGRVVFR